MGIVDNYTKISECISDMKDSFNEIRTDCDSFIISESTAQKLFIEMNFSVNTFLTKLFGSENDINKKGMFHDVLDYSNDKNIYSDAVAYSYWTYSGESNIYLQDKKTNDWRKNFFYKGVRWSNEYSRYKFYYFFKYFENISKGNTPVEFFVKQGIEFKKNYFIVKCLSSIESNRDDNVIALPCIKMLRGFNIETLNKLLDFIDEIKILITQEKSVFENSKEKKHLSFETFKDLYINARDELIKYNQLFEECTKSISSVFSKDVFKKYNNENRNKTIFDIIIILHYFDNPYDIHFFLPKTNRNNEKFRSSLVITTALDTNLSINDIKNFKEIIEILKLQTVIEKDIWTELKEMLPKYLHFKDSYLKLVDKYERISEMAINLIRAITYRKNIKFSYEIYRVKDFDSFFEKVIDIANGKNCDYETDEEKKFKEERKNIFEIIIKKGETTKVDVICSMLSDIAGARISCLFQDETKVILDELEELNKSNEIEIVKRKDFYQCIDDDKISQFGYRSHHRTFKLGAKRAKIYEFSDLENISCEYQIRTLLADVWANASHQLFYKTHYPDKLKKINKLARQFSRVSSSFEEKDETLVKIKIEIEKIINKLKYVSKN